MAESLAQIIAMREPTPVVLPAPAPRTAAEIVEASQREEREDTPEELAKHVLDVSNNPDRMLSIAERAGDDFDDHAPEVASDFRTTLLKTIQYLASKAPKEKVLSPGMPPVPPSRAEVNTFNRYINAIKDPTSILDDAYNGTLTPEAVDAVRTIYPETYAAMQTSIMQQIGNMAKIPYKRRIQISALLGHDVTGTMSPSIVMTAQQAYAPAQPEQKQQMPVSRAKAFNLSGRSQQETAAWREAQKGIGAWNRGNR